MSANVAALRRNPYPGRGIVIGLSPDGKRYVQVYWIMGRSENSRNRIFVNEGGIVKTRAYDESKVEDPSLIIYNATRVAGKCHVVSNGAQTDTVCAGMAAGKSFEQSLSGARYEPDAPNFTPRISGVVNLADPANPIQLSVLKASPAEPELCLRQTFCWERGTRGLGYCITTYTTDGSPLPSFEGEPYAVPLLDDAAETARFYWDVLNEDNKISLAVKSIDRQTAEVALEIVNKHQ
ncbi:MAG: inosine monophosphate cyclohydrolase [Anaerolineaceae bacterium]|nr:inosine monophosphate cyclohydrolase [Anaerolineaceae bacterium]